MIRQILTGLVFGIFGTLVFIQYDPWVHTQVGHLFTRTLSQVFKCEVHGTVRTVNFLVPEIVFDNFAMMQKKDGVSDWQWHAKIYRTGFSWLDVIVNNTVKLWAVVQDLQVTSKVEGSTIAIAPHIADLLAPPNLPIPLVFYDGYIKNGHLSLVSDTGKAEFFWDVTTHQLGNRSRAYFSILDGLCIANNVTTMEQASGKIVLDAYDDGTIEFKTDCQAQLCNLSEHPTVALTGVWQRNHGRFSIESLDKSLRVSPIIITQKNATQWFEIEAKLPASYASFLATGKCGLLQGDCSVAIKGTLDNPAFIDGHILGEHLKISMSSNSFMCSSAFYKRNHRWFGNIDVRLAERMMMHGSFKWDEQHDKGSAKIANTTSLYSSAYPYWNVAQQNCAITLDADAQGVIGTCTTQLRHELHGNTIDAVFELVANRSTGTYNFFGTARDFTLDCTGSFFSYPYINYMRYYREQHRPYVKVVHNNDLLRYQGVIQLSAARALAHHILGYDIQGEGAFEFHTKYDNEVLATQFHLQDGTVRLPQTFNFVNNLDGVLSFDTRQNTLALEDVMCRLYTGSLRIPHGKVWFDSSGGVSFCHVPLLFEHCLINMKRDLFAVVSGALAVSKKGDEMPVIKGSLLLDRSQLKENIFSELFQKNLFQAADVLQTAKGVALACDVQVATKDPIRINTGFLDAQAQINLSIKKQLTEPEIDGTICLLSGSLGFPYKPLHISRGKISFVKNQPLNPYIELVAKNKLKQHNVVLQVSGSVRDHFVLFESTPPLTDEQIIGLLLAGSHEESLSAVIPSLLVQNVTNIIFSTDQSGFLDRYVRPWLKQINVHFVPKFSEESGRGGLRGSIEIDVNERWRALIEKNFSLTEDTRFELEYLLSDDVRFRVTRDERCDIGTEVEMKWKF